MPGGSRTGRPRIAVATADLAALGIEDEDRPFLEEAFAGRADLGFERWDDPDVEWSAHDLVVLRSTWDYPRRLPEFLAWTDRTAAVTTLLNPARTVRWNSDKRYLGELARAGVPVVPTRYASGADDVPAVLREVGEIAASGAGGADGAGGAGGAVGAGGEVVVKPSVSAGSWLTGRFAADDPAARTLAARIVAAGKTVMVQPFVPSVAERGEVAVLFFGGEPSHAVRKGPLLAPGGGLLGGEYVEDLQPVELDRRHLEAAAGALRGYATVHPATDLLYARVDLVEHASAGLQVLELELIEPSLFLPQAPAAAAGRFAEAALTRCG